MRFRPSTGQSIGTTATGSEEEMGKLVVSEFVTLDGVIEDPGGAEGFDRGGWALSFDRGADGDAFKFEELMSAEAMLLGRVTYEGFAAAWPDRTDEAGFADKMNSMPKYVVSSTLRDPAWSNSTVIAGDVARSVSTLKRQLEGDLLVAGSARLVEALVEHELVDELRLMVFPVLLGSGKRLFGEHEEKQALRLTDSKTVGDGVVILVYEPVR
jgi:dihydrofolate reductase